MRFSLFEISYSKVRLGQFKWTIVRFWILSIGFKRFSGALYGFSVEWDDYSGDVEWDWFFLNGIFKYIIDKFLGF